MRQSIPATYLNIYVRGNSDIDIYVDVNGQWVSGDRSSNIVWDLEKYELAEGKGLKTWKVEREEELLFSEIADRAEWGTLYFSAPSVREPWLEYNAPINSCRTYITRPGDQRS